MHPREREVYETPSPEVRFAPSLAGNKLCSQPLFVKTLGLFGLSSVYGASPKATRLSVERRTVADPKITLVWEPTVIPLASMAIDTEGLTDLVKWVGTYRPECLPKEGEVEWGDLFPHDRQGVSDNELLVELAGRNCYHSYGLKAGRKSNAEYIAHSQSGTVPHRSITYHAKMTFFLAGISRHLSHELIRHYVGADREEEGSPSQESTRYTFHPGHFVVPPKVIEEGSNSVEAFERAMSQAYGGYLEYIRQSEEAFKKETGASPKGIDRKRIYEAAAGFLPMHATTSLFWTTNPSALNKLFVERTDPTSGAEFRRFAKHWRKLCCAKWPNLIHGE